MSRPLNKRVQYYMEYVAIRSLVLAGSTLPLSLLRRMGAGLGWFAWRVVGLRRDVVVENIQRAMQSDDERTIDHIALASYKNYGRSFAEMIAFKKLARKPLDFVTIEGREHMDSALEHGRGAILFTGHFGNWELMGAAIARSGYPLHVTDTNHSNERVHAVITDLRTSQRVGIIEPQRPVKYLLRLLESNNFIAYLADQNARAAGVFVDFFGKPAWTLRGPAVFAARRGCPIVPCFVTRDNRDHHTVVFHAPMWPDPGLEGDEAVIELTQRFTRVLEEQIRRHPDHYWWTHRRWKTQPQPPEGRAGA